MLGTLYISESQPQSRAVLMTVKALNIYTDITKVVLDFDKKEHLARNFTQINPQHTIPTFVDEDGFAIWDSHAIMAYIVSKYGRGDDKLCPKDPRKRAVVDQRLHFDCEIMSARTLQLYQSLKARPLQKNRDELSILEAFEHLDNFLLASKWRWIAGDCVTIADFSLLATVSSANLLVPFEKEKFPSVSEWLKRAENEIVEYQEDLKRGLVSLRKKLGLQ